MLRKIIFLSLFIFYFSFLTTAQPDSCNVKISLLTCTPGEDLYSTFGHSALRITDAVNNTDIVYNYGTFNFAEPGFYTKFIRGKLLYYLSTPSQQRLLLGLSYWPGPLRTTERYFISYIKCFSLVGTKQLEQNA